MGGFFSMDGKFFSFMSKIADLIILNIIWSLCCIPIVTIGPATTAMYYVTLKMVDNEESYIIRSFFKSFKQNLKQALGIWGLMLAAAIMLAIDIFIMMNWQAGYKTAFLMFFIFLFVIWTFVFLYIFPLLATFENTVKQTFKNALLMSIRHLPYTALMFIILIGPVVLVAFIVQLTPIWILIGFSLTAYANSFFLKKIFKLYMPAEEEETDDTEEDGLFADSRITDSEDNGQSLR